ncbi:hypothetical protein SAMD00019534_070020, partial [Acytostelium subglobosum LB1]|uniref:hypothetical protein n=1 Tax=Acytostelium subglobosum LB1 TaxID=1410327 RepID=UPI0006447C53
YRERMSSRTPPPPPIVVASTEYTAAKRKSVLSKRFRVQTESDRQVLRQCQIATHIDQLENDNEIAQDLDDDDDYVDDDDDMVYSTPKNKRKINRDRERKKHETKIMSFPLVLEKSYLDTHPSHVPTYLSVQSAPSIYPPRHFCSICGGIGNYSCKQCTMRYCSPGCYVVHNENRCRRAATANY